MDFESKVERVIVYSSGAQIVQVGKLTLPQGNQIIKISDLPDNLDKESIRVKGIGHGKIININVELNSKKEYNKEEYEELKAEREYLLKDIQKNQNELNRLNEQVANFKSVEDVFYETFPEISS